MKVVLPDVGEGIAEATIVKWHVKKGDAVGADDVLVDIETDKAVVNLPSPVSGVIEQILVKEGQVVKVGSAMVEIKERKKSSVSVVGDVDRATESSEATLGKITIDIKRKTQSPKADGPGVSALKTGALKKLKYDLWGHVKREPLAGTRKSIAENMVLSASQIPHVTHMDELDVSKVSVRREELKKKYPMVKITYLAFVLKALVSALKKHPRLNAVFNGDEIVFKEYYNFGFAVATKNGLLVPVVKGVDQKDVVQVAKEIENLAGKARERSINPMDMKGGSFTVTNIGSIGGLFFTPIIVPGQSAILGLGRIRDDRLPISLSYDHRVLDGADAALFVVTFAEELSKVR